ncbi:MAG: arginine--tRNA ligase [Eubacteriaceae bacterium]|jgi:arginyl-tRNA synthetase|nr:arginine--tRNA ligase [Eubacteriaceae bacterium]
MSVLQQAGQQIISMTAEAVGALGTEFSEEQVRLEVPKDKSFGEFSVNTAMQLASVLRKNPRQIAQEIIANMKTEDTYVQEVSMAGAGFINFRLSQRYYIDVIKEIFAQGDDYGKCDIGKGKRVNVEFVSANPTGPVHIGNARGGAVGDVLAEILSWAGYEVTREFYINDAGNQMEKFGASLEARYLEMFGKEFTFPEGGYEGDYIKEIALEYAKAHQKKLLTEESETRQEILARFGLEKNLSEIKRALDEYGVAYDVWYSENSLYEQGAVAEAIEQMKKTGSTYEEDGALWFRASEWGCDKDFVLVRSNGLPTYIMPDIAYHLNKLQTRKFDIAIDVWGADHHGYVPRMKSAIKALGIDEDRLGIILMQFVRLVRQEEVVRMSKRRGEMITLSDLVAEVGRDAARFLFNYYNFNTHMDFDLDLAVEKSNENPVFYVQYAHARICSIISQLRATETIEADLSLLTEEEEIELIKVVARFSEEIAVAAETFDTSRIPKYAVEIASAFHTFYNRCRVRCEEESLMYARVALIEAVRTVLKNLLNILGVSAPEKM